jgi:tubulin--tyrosine ligase
VNGLLKKKAVTFVENSPKLKMHNHLQCNYFLGNKKALFYTMKKYYELLNIPPFTKIPLTFHITQGMQDQEFLKFLEEF